MTRLEYAVNVEMSKRPESTQEETIARIIRDKCPEMYGLSDYVACAGSANCTACWNETI